MRVSLLAFISALFAACIIAPVVGQAAITGANDINTLNYALVLERLEAVYYQCYLFPRNNSNAECLGRGYTGFSQTDFANAGYNLSVWNAVNLIADQESAHAIFLVSAIQGASASPVPRCMYNLTALPGNPVINSVAAFLAVSQVLENTGVSAYAGAVNTLTNTDLATVAVQIASVEARHASWLNQLLGAQPFPSSGFDTYRTPGEIVAAIGGIFMGNTSCYTTLPTTRPYGVAGIANSNTTTNQTGPLASANNLAYSAAQRANDIKTLNYALTLEQLEAAFYNSAAAIFNQASFVNAGLPASAFNYFGIITANENTHVAVLRQTISAYGGTPAPNCTYNFNSSLSSFQNYLNTAQLLENTGTYAYAGAANTITDTNLQRIAATIAMVEARHAAYLNIYNTSIPNNPNAFPATQDPQLTPAQVVSAVLASGLITSCPYPLDSTTLPVVLPYGAGVPSSTAGSVTPSGSSSSTGRNGAASSASFSMAMIIVAIVASLALVL